jgi:acyl-CoA thioesterase
MNVKGFINKDRYAVGLGIELIEAADGKAKAKLDIKDIHLNAMDYANGGAIFSLADLTLAAAANSHGNLSVSINVSISFIKTVGKGTLFAEAIETSRNNKIATYTISITNEQGELIACVHGMVYRKKETFQNLI